MRKRKIQLSLLSCAVFVLAFAVTSCAPRRGEAQEIPTDPGWPRIVETDEAEVVIYQPQIDTWESYVSLEGWVAIEVTLKEIGTPVVGSIRLSADTETDFDARTVLVYNKQIQEVNIDTDDKELDQRSRRCCGRSKCHPR